MGAFAANASAVASPAPPACMSHMTANVHKLLLYSDVATLHCVDAYAHLVHKIAEHKSN